MKGTVQRFLVLIMIATMASWSQAEICPMKLQSQKAEACSSAMPMMQHRHHAMAATSHHHDCCPKDQKHTSTKAECPDHQLSACVSAMACCSLDVPLSGTSRTLSLSISAVSVSASAIFPLLVRTSRISTNRPVSTENSVFRLKEDLRI
jgi:hypothetical protein